MGKLDEEFHSLRVLEAGLAGRISEIRGEAKRPVPTSPRRQLTKIECSVSPAGFSQGWLAHLDLHIQLQFRTFPWKVFSGARMASWLWPSTLKEACTVDP